MITTITNLTTCTQYRVEIGAGPNIYKQLQDTTIEYDKEDDKLLEEIINKVWTLDETAFRAFASTSPVSKFTLYFSN